MPRSGPAPCCGRVLLTTIVPVEVALGLGALIPGCRVERIANAGHFWVYDNIELVLSELRKLSS